MKEPLLQKTKQTWKIWVLMCGASVVFLLSLEVWSRKVRSGTIFQRNALKMIEEKWEKIGVQMDYDDGESALAQADGYKILPGYEARRDAAITEERQTNEKLDAANARMRTEEEQEFMWLQTRVMNRKKAEVEWQAKQAERKAYKEKAELNLEAAKNGDEISPSSASTDNNPSEDDDKDLSQGNNSNASDESSKTSEAAKSGDEISPSSKSADNNPSEDANKDLSQNDNSNASDESSKTSVPS